MDLNEKLRNEPLRVALLEQQPARRRRPRGALTEQALLVVFCLLAAAVIVLVARARSHACTPEPFQCCIDVACDGGDLVTYETKVPIGGTTSVFGTTVTLRYLRRLGVPTDPAQADHVAVYEAEGLPRRGGEPFSGTTDLGAVAGELGAGRFVATTARKGLTGPPDPAPVTQLWACYGLQNTGGTRQPVSWVDQFGAHDGTVGKPSYVCLPANAATPRGFVCYGSARDVGRAPEAPVYVQAPFGPFGDALKLEPVDEYCRPLR